MVSQAQIEEIIQKTILLYNRLNAPMAFAKAVHVSPEIITVSFSGSFCYECGDTLKYVEEFARDFKVFVDFLKLTIGTTRQISSNNIEVHYIVTTR